MKNCYSGGNKQVKLYLDRILEHFKCSAPQKSKLNISLGCKLVPQDDPALDCEVLVLALTLAAVFSMWP